MERPSKRSRSATKPSKTAGKRKHSSKSASVKSYNKTVSKTQAVRALANAVTLGFMGIEKKFLDTARTQVAVAGAVALTGGVYDPSATSGSGGGTGGCVGCLSCPAQGDTEQSRDGKRIVIDSLIIKGNLNYNASASQAVSEAQRVFFAVVLDTQTNGAQLTSDQVFKNLTADASTVCQPLKNLLFGGRFRILKSQTFDLTPVGTFGAGTGAHYGTQRDFDWYIPFKGGLPINMNAGTTADVANVIDNSIHVIAFANVGAAVELAYNARIRFQG